MSRIVSTLRAFPSLSIFGAACFSCLYSLNTSGGGVHIVHVVHIRGGLCGRCTRAALSVFWGALCLLGRSLFVGRGRLFSYRIASMRGAAISGGVWTLHPAAGLSVLRLCPPAARKGKHGKRTARGGLLFSTRRAFVHIVHVVHIRGGSCNLLNVWRLSVLSIFVHIGGGAVHSRGRCCLC